MKKLQNGMYLPNTTDVKRAAAHLRRLMREKPNIYVCCTFLPESGIFVYDESIDCFTVTIRNEPEFTVSYHIGKQYDCGESLREFMHDILDFMKGETV